MRKELMCLVVAFCTAVCAFAAPGYVTAKICPVLAAADFSSSRVAVLKNGDKVDCLVEEGRWVKIRKGDVEGFIQKTFIGNAPNATVAMGNSMENFVNMDVRKRASVYSTTAAAIRGLGSENVRERENMKFSNYDFESLKWIEANFSFSEDEIESFYEK